MIMHKDIVELFFAPTPLERAVLEWLSDAVEDNEPLTKADIVSALDELMTHGCQSGLVGELIYYSDTTKFYAEHKIEIGYLLNELLSSAREPMYKLFPEWDSEDPLALKTHNQNILAWFGFEETARRLLDRIE
jgi:hypothetical protein